MYTLYIISMVSYRVIYESNWMQNCHVSLEGRRSGNGCLLARSESLVNIQSKLPLIRLGVSDTPL